ncbi:MAG TPA: NADH-quinone oxidoreductase subunit C [Acidimicrobiales bacterium]|nr:NADH-quinone oxidoreductase subunit C [Acidimicrobiales bacterium]
MSEAGQESEIPEEPPAPETLLGAPVGWSHGQQVVHPPRSGYLDTVESLYGQGFNLCSDLCAVDYLAHLGRPLPEGVGPERFEVVVNVTSLALHRRLRIRVQVPEGDPVVASLFAIHPGTEAMEREAYDLMGIRFEGHPDLTRIMMPEDWEGHPLRKDYSVGRVPVQFKAAPLGR